MMKMKIFEIEEKRRMGKSFFHFLFLTTVVVVIVVARRSGVADGELTAQGIAARTDCIDYGGLLAAKCRIAEGVLQNMESCICHPRSLMPKKRLRIRDHLDRILSY